MVARTGTATAPSGRTVSTELTELAETRAHRTLARAARPVTRAADRPRAREARTGQTIAPAELTVARAGRTLARAERAVTLAAADPARARDIAEDILAAHADPEVRAVALRALALAAKELGQLAAGIAHLREAVLGAELAGHDYRAAQARMSLVALLAAGGAPEDALAVADAAAPVLRGLDAARLLANRVAALTRCGMMDEALATCTAALPRLRAGGDEVFLARALVDAALVRLYRGETGAATADLSRALAIARSAGLDHLALLARDGLAFAALRAGDLPRALRLYDEIEQTLDDASERAGQVRMGRAQALMAARLPGEARAVLRAALGSIAERGYAADHAEGRLLLVQAELACASLGYGSAETAAQIAERLRRDCARQGRPGWALVAAHLELRARWAIPAIRASAERMDSMLERAREVAGRLARAGLAVAAADSQALAGRIALELGRLDLAGELLGAVAGDVPPGDAAGDSTGETAGDTAGGGRVRRTRRIRAPIVVQVAGWHARALERLSRGDRRAAGAAVRAGLAAVERNAALLGATELRAHATGWGAELATVGLRLAVASRRPRAVLAWAERGRAVADRPVALRPPADPRLAAELAELREVCDRIATALGNGDDPRPWYDARLRIEASVLARTRRVSAVPADQDAPTHRPVPGRPPTRRQAPARQPPSSKPASGPASDRAPAGRPPPDEPASRPVSRGRSSGGHVAAALVAALGERAFVELVRLDDALLAVAVVAGRCRLRELGSYERAVGAARVLRFEAHRLARREAAGGAHGPAGADIAAAADRLDAQLLGPLRRILGDRELVLAPTGRLHGLPWPALAGLSGRPLSVVPSAGAWLRAAGSLDSVQASRAAAEPLPGGGAASRTGGHTVLVAGPGLSHAEPEITALRALYPGASVLTGAAARAEPVRAAMDGAGLVHLATHGDFRADNALFSSLRLADGPLWAYDLEALRRAPRLVVLAACDAGRAEVHEGEAVVGIAGVLLGFGARTVIASVTPVGDEATGELMRGLHRRLAAGDSPARALAEAPRPPGAAGFVCFGAG